MNSLSALEVLPLLLACILDLMCLRAEVLCVGAYGDEWVDFCQSLSSLWAAAVCMCHFVTNPGHKRSSIITDLAMKLNTGLKPCILKQGKCGTCIDYAIHLIEAIHIFFTSCK